MFLFGPEGELGSCVLSGSSKEAVFRVFFPFLLLLPGSSVEDVLAEATSSSSMDSKEVSLSLLLVWADNQDPQFGHHHHPDQHQS